MPYQDPYSDFDQAFDDMRRATFPGWGGASGTPRLGMGGFAGVEGPRMPMVDLVDEGDRYLLTAELPGVRKEDIRLTVRDNVVRLHAERDETLETSQPSLGEQAERTLKRGAGRAGGQSTRSERYIRRERSQMTFDRVIRLPEEVRSDQAGARFANGVLRVALPKADVEQGGGRAIPIE